MYLAPFRGRLPRCVWVNAAGRNQEGSGLRPDPALLVIELRFTGIEVIIQISGPKQRAVQAFGIRFFRVMLAVPVRVAAGIGGVTLQIDRSGAENRTQ